MNDIVSDGTFLWLARNDGKVLKVNAADRRLLETWSLAGNATPRKLGLFLGLVMIADNQGSLQSFNPAGPAGTASVNIANALPPSNLATLAFDGTNVWMGNAASSSVLLANFNTAQAGTVPLAGNVDGLVFDGANMWVLLANTSLLKMNPPVLPAPPAVVETLTSDAHCACRVDNRVDACGPGEEASRRVSTRHARVRAPRAHCAAGRRSTYPCFARNLK